MMRSIRWRLTLSYVALALVTALTVGLLTLFLIRHYIVEQEREYLAVTGRSITRQVLPLLRSGRSREELRRLVEANSFLSNVRIRLLDRERDLLIDTGDQKVLLSRAVSGQSPDQPPGRRPLHPPPETLALTFRGLELTGPFERGERGFALVRRQSGLMPPQFVLEPLEAAARPEAAKRQEQRYSDQHLTLPVGDQGRPYGFVELSQGPDFRRQTLAASLRAIAISAAAAVLLALLIGLLMSRKLADPLVKLAAAVSDIDGDNFAVRVPDLGNDEIGQLSRQFNRMAERLGQSFRELARERDSLKQFAADASHELRTPLTALKTYNELLQSAAGRDARTRREFLLESQGMLNRLEWIVGNLLDLSRYDAGICELDIQEQPAESIIRGALQACKQRIEEKKIAVTVEVEQGGGAVACDRERIELALVNLLDNSLKYLDPGGSITIGAWKEPDAWCFRVKDTGRGIDQRDLPHIFNRFYRGRKSTETGSGLGLAIVKSVVEAHGGSVEANSVYGEGSELIFRLPVRGG
jgi:signal transduction histidine kinase